MLQCGTEMAVFNPILKNNTYVQFEGGQFGMVGEKGRRMYDADVESLLKDKYGEKDAKVYLIKKS